MGVLEKFVVFNLQFTLHCNYLPLVVTYNNDASNGFSRKESVAYTTDKRDHTECYHSYTSKDDVSRSVKVHCEMIVRIFKWFV